MLVRLIPFWMCIKWVLVASYFDADEIKSEYYDFSIMSASPALLQTDAEGQHQVTNLPESFVDHGNKNHVLIGNKFGRPFYCGIPERIYDRESETTGQIVRRQLLDAVTEQEIEELLKIQLTRCIKRANGWWTYELCYQHGIVYQYHADDYGSVIDDFAKLSLGRLSPADQWNKTEHYDKYVDRKKQLYYSKHFIHGSTCDISGNLRKTEVRFYCDDELLGTDLRYIEEPETCMYTLHVYMTGLCRLKAFQPIDNKKKQNLINCVATLNENEMDTYKRRLSTENPKKTDQPPIPKENMGDHKQNFLIHTAGQPALVTQRFAEQLQTAFTNIFDQKHTIKKSQPTSNAFDFKQFIDERVAEEKLKKRESKEIGRAESQESLVKLALSLSKLINTLEQEIETAEHDLTDSTRRTQKLMESSQKLSKTVDQIHQSEQQPVDSLSKSTSKPQMTKLEDEKFDGAARVVEKEIGQKFQKAGTSEGANVKVELSAAYYDENAKKIRLVKNAENFGEVLFSFISGSDEKRREEEKQSQLSQSYHFDL